MTPDDAVTLLAVLDVLLVGANIALRMDRWRAGLVSPARWLSVRRGTARRLAALALAR